MQENPLYLKERSIVIQGSTGHGAHKYPFWDALLSHNITHRVTSC